MNSTRLLVLLLVVLFEAQVCLVQSGGALKVDRTIVIRAARIFDGKNDRIVSQTASNTACNRQKMT